MTHPVDVVLLLLGEAEDVEGLVRELHVLLVVDGLHGDLALGHEVVVTDVVAQFAVLCMGKRDNGYGQRWCK